MNMGFNIADGDISTVKGWGATISTNLRKAARDVANLTAGDMAVADISALKAAIDNFDELRELAARLNVNIYGYKLPEKPVISFVALTEPDTRR
jgi:hypothetical protein